MRIDEINMSRTATLSELNDKNIKFGFEVEFLSKSKASNRSYTLDDPTFKVFNVNYKSDNMTNKYKNYEDKDSWFLTYDESVKEKTVKDDDDDINYSGGFELVSPVFELTTGLKELHRILSIINNSNDLYTNGTCGLHINLSLNNTNKDDFDILKMIIMLGDDHLKNLFTRKEYKDKFTYDNLDYIKTLTPALNNIIDNVISYHSFITKSNFDITTYTFNKWVEILNNAIKTTNNEIKHSKSFTAAFNKLIKYNYLEFRVIGGENYESRWNEIQESIGRFIKIMNIGIDNSYDTEYKKKLYKVLQQRFNKRKNTFSSSETKIEKYINHLINDIDKEYGSFVPDYYKELSYSSNDSNRNWDLLIIMYYEATKDYPYLVNDQFKRLFKYIILSKKMKNSLSSYKTYLFDKYNEEKDVDPQDNEDYWDYDYEWCSTTDKVKIFNEFVGFLK